MCVLYVYVCVCVYLEGGDTTGADEEIEAEVELKLTLCLDAGIDVGEIDGPVGVCAIGHMNACAGQDVYFGSSGLGKEDTCGAVVGHGAEREHVAESIGIHELVAGGGESSHKCKAIDRDGFVGGGTSGDAHLEARDGDGIACSNIEGGYASRADCGAKLKTGNLSQGNGINHLGIQVHDFLCGTGFIAGLTNPVGGIDGDGLNAANISIRG